MKKSVYILGAKRTPFGTFGGALKDVSATDLTVSCSKAAISQSGIDPKSIDHVVIGNVVQSASDSIYLPRHVGLKCEIPTDVPALGINRLCGSGFQSWVNAYQMIQEDEASVVLAGGAEQMSQIPYVVRGARFGMRMGHGEVEDFMIASLTDQFTGMPMAITAENLAEQFKISREEVDKYALMSQMRCKLANDKGLFKEEISTVSVATRKGTTEVEKDEHPRPDATLEALLKLKPVFKKDGVVTAGNASGIVDGAAATILASEERVKQFGAKPLARLVSYASVGCDPKIMGIGPVNAIKKALIRAGMKIDQMDLVEVNEAFSAQFLAVQKSLELDLEKTNVNGGAIAIGHPLGASGTRIMNHLVYELIRRKKKYAVGSACIGGGQGIAVVIENTTI
ncbi:MAG: acetyl-CoA C-acetyltransferase [Bdellovibrionales bacterium]|nr:acetyl-CoA C-acetyltransferase [Bdellovibrionales bacterium]